MQKMLRRTVTVGTQYAVHLWTIYLFVFSIAIAFFILAGVLNWQSFTGIGVFVVVYCSLGIAVSFYALSRIQDKAAQIRSDVARIKMMLNDAFGKKAN